MANNMLVTDRTPVVSAVTVLAMHFDGSNGSASFIDSAAAPHTISRIGTPTLSTAFAKFGTAGGAFSSGQYLSTPASADWNLNSGDFTIDAWVNLTSAPDALHLIGTANPWFGQGNGGGAGGFGVRLDVGGMSVVANGGVANTVSGLGAWATLTWHHIAVTRSGSTLYMFKNGTLVYSGAAGTLPADTTSTLYIAGNPDHTTNAQLLGALDDLRIIKGQALWTATFTPPAATFTP